MDKFNNYNGSTFLDLFSFFVSLYEINIIFTDLRDDHPKIA